LQKVNYSIFILVIATSCSVFRGINEDVIDKIKNGSGKSQSEIVRERNLSVNSFYIKNMELIIYKDNEVEKLLGSLRFEEPDKFLISLKSRTGIEISRIFINKDSVYIVDRIKKKVYSGEVKYLENKFGLPLGMIPVLFGDYKGVCEDVFSRDSMTGSLLSKCSLNMIKVEYKIDSRIGKVKSVTAENKYGEAVLTADFRIFRKKNEGIFPSEIVLSDFEKNIKVEISVKKIEYPWNEKLDFSFGSRYEVIELL
jgi:hypothetical protein